MRHELSVAPPLAAEERRLEKITGMTQQATALARAAGVELPLGSPEA